MSMGPPTRSGYDKKLDTAERMAMKLANPESRTFENYLGKVMKSVQNRKRMSLAPDQTDPLITGLGISQSLPYN